MSDSFANLWNTSAGTGPKPAQRTLGGAMAAQPSAAGTAGARRPGPDAFSILASSKPALSTPATRSQTPASTSSAPPSKPPSRGPNDAFSGLLSGSGTFSAGNEAGMSMAQRAAKAEAERRAALERQQAASKKQNAAWAGLDALGSSSLPTAGPISPSNDDDDWLFGNATSPATTRSPPSAATSPPPAKHPQQADDWGLDDFISAPAVKPSTSSSRASPAPAPKPTKATGSFWDLDALEAAPAPAAREVPSRSRTPGDFDFGDREDGPSNGASGDEDDILGALGRPASERRPSPRATATPPTRSGRSSPPPHLIGQIVEMGYTLEQARVALAATDSGEDVQAAIEILLSGGTPEPASAPSNGSSRRGREEDDGWGDAPRRRFNYDDDDDDAPPRRAPPRNPAASPPTSPPTRPGMSRTNSSAKEREGEGIQTDKLIAQASEIGLSVFNRANALWKTGKERAQKLYEEQQAARAASAVSSSAPPRKDGRPKWMQDAAGKDGEPVSPPRRRPQAQEAPAFADDDGPAPAAQRRPRPAPADTPAAAVPPTDDLFSVAPAEPPRQYRRRHSPPRTRAAPAAAAPAPSKAVPQAAPSLITRQTVTATPAAIAASERHKVAGTEMFRLGRYAEAESSYSSAISTLPDNHLLLIPLFNNRAAARFKIGDTAGAIADSTTVISLVGADYRPGTEKKVERKEEGAGVDLGQALVKAWKRRAESLEGREKWSEALSDWERVAGCDFAGALRREGANGAARCRKATAPAAPKPKPKPAALSRPPARPAPPSEAASRLKKANAEAEAEDNAKYELKDLVEARITAWKGGKDTNIRALISSLENVLWPELGWVKVGMGELLTPSQVKIRYTKAIAKLHPDKLNARNTTVEQRMIANGVFSALNDAWNAFQQSN